MIMTIKIYPIKNVRKIKKKNNRTVLQGNWLAFFLHCFIFKKIENNLENSNDWNNLTSRILWSQISEEAAAQYHFEIKL